MQARRLILIGGGGHATVVAEAATLAGFEVAGFLDDRADAAMSHAESERRCLGPLRDSAAVQDRDWIVAVGDLALREELIAAAPGGDGARPAAVVIHPSAVVSPSARIGAGVFIGPGAIVNARAEIGAHAIINSGAVVEHDCRIGMNAHIAPRVALGGTSRVGDRALVGIGASVLPGVTIGRGATVGVGAAVVGDVADGATVAGVPAASLNHSQRSSGGPAEGTAAGGGAA